MNLFYPVNLLVPLLAILPSLIYIFLPPKRPVASVKVNVFITIFEKFGQVGVCVLPIFLPFHFSPIPVVFMVVALLLYYLAWARYFATRKVSFLYKPLFYIPLPLAVFPIIYFLFGALSFNAPMMYVSWLLLAIGHLGVTYKNYLATKSLTIQAR